MRGRPRADLTVTLGSPVGAGVLFIDTVNGVSVATWTPDADLRDAYGNPITGTSSTPRQRHF